MLRLRHLTPGFVGRSTRKAEAAGPEGAELQAEAGPPMQQVSPSGASFNEDVQKKLR